MKAIILGGIGTTKKHITRTKMFYKNKGIEPIFYKAGGLFGSDLFRKDKWKDHVNFIIKDITTPYFLHCFSGSCFIGYEINSNVNAKAIILESGPTEPTIKNFQNFININYGIKIPYSFIKYGMDTFSIYALDKDEFANKWYYDNKPKKNVIILAGCKDNLIDLDYINRDYISTESNNKIVLFVYNYSDILIAKATFQGFP